MTLSNIYPEHIPWPQARCRNTEIYGVLDRERKKKTLFLGIQHLEYPHSRSLLRGVWGYSGNAKFLQTVLIKATKIKNKKEVDLCLMWGNNVSTIGSDSRECLRLFQIRFCHSTALCCPFTEQTGLAPSVICRHQEGELLSKHFHKLQTLPIAFQRETCPALRSCQRW